MKKLEQGLFVGERALYNSKDLEIVDSTFMDGESPLKESRNIKLRNCIFKWKYPLWYCNHVEVFNTTWLDTARSGIWYTHDLRIIDSFIEAPKQFTRSSDIYLENVTIPNAEETFWTCENITLKNVVAKGNYFCMNSKNIKVENFTLAGNYAFDGAKNIEIHNAKMNSKDSFWNCENVVVYDSTIIGEYLGWNSKNIKFVNCTIDSLQGMCYMDNITMENCKLLNTNLCFEFCHDVDATINSRIDSVKNPYNGVIKAKAIDEIILDENLIDKSKTTIIEGK
jgi:hypothetical protein